MDFIVDLYLNFPWTILNTVFYIAGYKITLFDCIVFGFLLGLFVWSIKNIFDF